jgi:hypothetical protein
MRPPFTLEIRGGFHKSWAHGVKRKTNPNLGENLISWAKAQIHDAKLGKKIGAECKFQA